MIAEIDNYIWCMAANVGLDCFEGQVVSVDICDGYDSHLIIIIGRATAPPGARFG